MKTKLLLFFLSVQISLSAQDVKNISGSHSTKLIKHLAYTTCIDTVINLPIWVSHYINNQRINTSLASKERPEGYPADPMYAHLKNNAYSSSGYDHGHLAPAADFKWSDQAWDECFYMTNMTPQHGCLNQIGWCYLESLCRDWARKADINENIYIVSGIIPNHFIDTLCIKQSLRVFVPAQFYKVVLSYNSKTKKAKGIGFVVPNADLSNEAAINDKTTIDEVEKLTHLDFFSFLDPSIEKQAESEIGFTDLTCQSECTKSSCNSVYTGKRILPNKRTRLKCN